MSAPHRRPPTSRSAPSPPPSPSPRPPCRPAPAAALTAPRPPPSPPRPPSSCRCPRTVPGRSPPLRPWRCPTPGAGIPSSNCPASSPGTPAPSQNESGELEHPWPVRPVEDACPAHPTTTTPSPPAASWREGELFTVLVLQQSQQLLGCTGTDRLQQKGPRGRKGVVRPIESQSSWEAPHSPPCPPENSRRYDSDSGVQLVRASVAYIPENVLSRGSISLFSSKPDESRGDSVTVQKHDTLRFESPALFTGTCGLTSVHVVGTFLWGGSPYQLSVPIFHSQVWGDCVSLCI